MFDFNKNLSKVALLLVFLTGCSKGGSLRAIGDDIAKQAKSYIGHIDWAQGLEKKSIDGKFTFKAGEPKCNLFLYDVIYPVVGCAPHNGYHPHTAKKWASSDSIKHWKYMGTSEKWQPGDVIAKQIDYANATGHCGIAISSTEVVAAGTSKVSQGSHGLKGGTVRRYTSD